MIRRGPDGSTSFDGGFVGNGGTGAGGSGVSGAAGLPGQGGSWFNSTGGSNAGGAASITCGMTQCPDCTTTAFFGTACCKSDGTCGCKAFFGIGNCQ